MASCAARRRSSRAASSRSLRCATAAATRAVPSRRARSLRSSSLRSSTPLRRCRLCESCRHSPSSARRCPCAARARTSRRCSSSRSALGSRRPGRLRPPPPRRAVPSETPQAATARSYWPVRTRPWPAPPPLRRQQQRQPPGRRPHRPRRPRLRPRRRGSHDGHQIAVEQVRHAVPPTVCRKCSVRCGFEEPWSVEGCRRDVVRPSSRT
mmetsp:Transcript_11186/g.28033  ORF Transcript_11186/g.28033 Transcript_11186/m.28033 type:complete len:209 (-) Transcript_11186:49-675(-)